MSAASFKIGDKAIHIECYGCSGRRWIRLATIVRETKTQWVDDAGARWRKSDLAMFPQYPGGSRYIVSEARWAAIASML